MSDDLDWHEKAARLCEEMATKQRMLEEAEVQAGSGNEGVYDARASTLDDMADEFRRRAPAA